MTQPVTPDLTNAGMDVTELAVGAKDVIASTAERFTSVIEGLLQHLSLENVLMQIAAVFVSMAIGYVISRRINTLVDRVLPGEDVRGLDKKHRMDEAKSGLVSIVFGSCLFEGHCDQPLIGRSGLVGFFGGVSTGQIVNRPLMRRMPGVSYHFSLKKIWT